MRKKSYIVACLLALAAGVYFLTGSLEGRSAPVATARAAYAPSPACTFPSSAASTPELTAWQIFVAANCPSNKGKVVWENWIEQAQVYPASGAAGKSVQGPAPGRRLHGSPLARALKIKGPNATQLQLNPTTECNTMNGPPPNVIPKAIICEEVRMNPSAVVFVAKNGYRTRPPQTAAAQKGTDIEFPTPAIEIKADWIPGTDFNPPFTCSNPPQGVYVEQISGTCYALAGMHISSKLLKDWLWATFEPQSMTTNPLRCITFGPCVDPVGSVPAVSKGGAGGFTQQTPAIANLMKQANLAQVFFNYRLDGVQTQFTKPDGTPTYLGNSIIEGENVGMTFNTASCITCHSVSSIENNGTDGITVLGNMPNAPVGPQYQIPSGWIARDFAWSMGLACPDVPNGGGLQPCTSSAKPKKKK